MPICSKCGNTKTTIRKSGYVEWYKWNEQIVCKNCYMKLYYGKNSVKWKIWNSCKLFFKGKQITLSKNPRTGICQRCGRSVQKEEIKRTHMHHEKYDETDPLAHTIELCGRCHKQRHAQIGRKIVV